MQFALWDISNMLRSFIWFGGGVNSSSRSKMEGNQGVGEWRAFSAVDSDGKTEWGM